MTERRRSSRLNKTPDEPGWCVENANKSSLYQGDKPGTSKNPYSAAQEMLEQELEDSFISCTDEEFKITQDDEDGTVGFRIRRSSISASPTRQRKARKTLESDRSRSASKRRDESSTTDNETFSFSELYDRLSLHVEKYKYQYCVAAISLVILSLFVCAILGVRHTRGARNFDYDKYKGHVDELFRTYPDPRNIKTVLYLLGQKILKDPKHDPFFILVASPNEDRIFEFVRAFESLVESHNRVELINLDETSTRSELNSNVSKVLADGKAVILHRIDRLKADAPQVLHAMSDSETSPYKSSILVGTIKLDDPISNLKDCVYSVQSHLENEWTSEKLPMNQFSPILSRITSFTICI